MLETNVYLTHANCPEDIEARYWGGAFRGHRSVTELTICCDVADYNEAADASFEAAAEAERAASRYLDNQWDDPDEALRTASGAIAVFDPQLC